MDKLEKLRELMKENNIDVYYIPSDDDHMSEYVANHFRSGKYISGFTGSSGVIIVTKDKAGLWTDGRYFIQAENQLKGTGIKLYKQRVEGEQKEEEFIKENIPYGGTLGFDGNVVNEEMAEYFKKIIKDKNGSVKLDKDLVGSMWEDRPCLPDCKTFFLEDEYTGESVESKINTIKNKMKEDKEDVLIFTSLEDVAWLFNLRGKDIENTPLNYAYALINDDVILYINKDKLDSRSLEEFNKNNNNRFRK